MVPIFLHGIETWRYVLAASKHHTIDVTKHFGNIRTVVSFGTHKETCIITQIADTIGIELIGRYGAAFIIYVRSFYLWQHGHINACLSKGLHDIGAKLIIRIGTPRNGNLQLFPIIIYACLRAYATEDDDNCGYKPCINSFLFFITISSNSNYRLFVHHAPVRTHGTLRNRGGYRRQDSLPSS